MAENLITRRAFLPGAALTTTAALAGTNLLASAPAEAMQGRRIFNATAGPCNLWRGHTIVYQFFLPASDRGSKEASEFSLALKTLDGKTFHTHNFTLKPGTGTEVRIAVDGDGSVLVNDVKIPNAPQFLVVIAIIAILIGLLLPAVQKVRANTTSFVPGRAAGEQLVDYMLPFIELES